MRPSNVSDDSYSRGGDRPPADTSEEERHFKDYARLKATS